MRTQTNVTVECLRCRHVGMLTAETLARLAITPSTPIAAFVKRLRCHKCGSHSVLATRKPSPRPQKGFLMCGRFTVKMTLGGDRGAVQAHIRPAAAQSSAELQRLFDRSD